MATVSDLIAGASVAIGSDGVSVHRAFIVDGLSGNADKRLFDATQHSDIPRRGQAHPSIPGVRADTITAVPCENSDTKALVTVEYKQVGGEWGEADETQPAQISVGATVQEEETNKDIDGNQIIIYYTTMTETAGEIVTAEKPSQTGTIQMQVPHVVFRFVRREASDPSEKARLFVGTVNSTTFRNDPERWWMCTRLDGESADGGVTYTVTYEFQRNPSTWAPTVAWVDPDTQQIPTDIDGNIAHDDFSEHNGIRRVEVYPEMDFGALNL